MRIPSGWAWLALATSLSHGVAADESRVTFTFDDIKDLMVEGNPTSIFDYDKINEKPLVVNWSARDVVVEKFTLSVFNTTSNESSSIGSVVIDRGQPKTTGGQQTSTSPTSTGVQVSTTCKPRIGGGIGTNCPPTPTGVDRRDGQPQGLLQNKIHIISGYSHVLIILIVQILFKEPDKLHIEDAKQLLEFHGLPIYFEAFWFGGGSNSSSSRAFTVMRSADAKPSWTSEYFVEDKAFHPDGFRPSVSPGATNTAGSSAASSDGGLATGAIAGIAVGAVVLLALIGGAVWLFIRRRRQARDDDDTLDAYGARRTRTDELMAEKEANAGVDATPHSPYSDDGGVQRDSSSLHNVATGAGVAAAAVGAHHKKNLSESSQPADDVPRTFTPYSDHRNSVAQSPSTHTASVVAASTVSPGGMESPTAGRATPHGGLTTPYAHLVEEGMTADEIRRLEDEERALDAAIEQSAVRKP